MGGQSKVCIEKWETLKVKSSLNIRFCAVEGEQKLINRGTRNII